MRTDLHTAAKTRSFVRSLTAALIALPLAASAAQFVDARDGDTALAKVSIKDQTRIKLERGRITDLIGDVYNAEKNPTGRLVVIPDEQDGELYVRPTDGNPRPIKVDLRTDRGKFSVLLQPIDVPGDTIVLRPKGLAQPKGEAAAQAGGESTVLTSLTSSAGSGVPTPAAALPRNASHLRTVKSMTLALASEEAPADVEVRPINQVINLWREARFVHVSNHVAREVIGETYELTNVSGAPMVIDERELYRDGVRSVAVKFHQLPPGARTPVWIVRDRLASD